MPICTLLLNNSLLNYFIFISHWVNKTKFIFLLKHWNRIFVNVWYCHFTVWELFTFKCEKTFWIFKKSILQKHSQKSLNINILLKPFSFVVIFLLFMKIIKIELAIYFYLFYCFFNEKYFNFTREIFFGFIFKKLFELTPFFALLILLH